MTHRTVTSGAGGDGAGFEVVRPPAWARWLPAVYVLVVLLLEFALPRPWAVSFLLIVLPAVAAYTSGPVVVAAITVFAVALEITLATAAWERYHAAAYVATVVGGVMGCLLTAHLRRQEGELVRVGSVAEALMRTILRPVPRQVGGLLAAGLYRSEERGTVVGGDFYDIRATDAGVRAVVGDVRGKGLPAVRTVAALLGSFREAAYEHNDLAEVAARMERRMVREVEALGDDELFATAVLVECDVPARLVTIVDLGHVEPLLLSGGEVRVLAGPPSLPLGLGTLAGRWPTTSTHRLNPGDVLLLCTDGVVEARDRAGDFYPLRERLRHFLAGRPAGVPAEVVGFLEADLPRHAPSLQDDVAVLALALRA